MKILVTGSEGNIGTKLVPYLISCGHTVYCVDIKQKYGENYILADINHPLDIYDVAFKIMPDIIINLAAMVSRITCEKSAGITVDTNIGGMNNMLQIAKMIDAKFVYFSTSEIYGDIGGLLSEDRKDIAPNNRYGLTKYLGEKLVEYEVENYGLEAVTVRPFMFYDEDENFGENRSAMIRFAENLIVGNRIDVHVGAKRSWMHISDGVRVIEKALHLNSYEIINIGHPDVMSVKDVALKMCEILNLNYYDCVNEIQMPDKMTLEKIPDLTKQRELLGILPKVSFDDGIKKVIEVVKNRIKRR